MVPEPLVDENLAIKHGLSHEEFERIISILGRIPTYTELGIFSVMWSEHCSYKNSLKVIRSLPRKGEKLLAEAGEENAGLVDIGDNLAIAFKIESHNHPSAVEPFQGAATGVGGILRDVFTLGARPIAVLNSLRFGDLAEDRTRYFFSQVVKGIGHYGNCFGVPTVGGEVYFDKTYSSNPIVNAMAVGVLQKDRIVTAVASGVGNRVLLVGSATGRDGIHGATFASEEITSESEERRPAVQVGDPFTEKCLLEALMEAAEANCLVSVQDMGAAGIICSTSEMSARGGVGMEINLDLVPARERDMTPYEIVLSESQERMLVIVKPDKLKTVREIFARWDIDATEIGEVINDDVVRFSKEGKVVAEVPATCLVAGFGAPVYEREIHEPAYFRNIKDPNPDQLPVPSDLGDVLLRLLESPNIASKGWVFRQYDHDVQTNTVIRPGLGASLVRVKGTKKILALTTDGNSRYVYLNARIGGRIAVAEAARNLVCMGATPIAITNCLNFGNPYDPEIYWQFVEAVRGIAEACVKLGTPVTGGNVSFYNEGPEGAIWPTPVIGMLGLLDDPALMATPTFKDEGDLILLLGRGLGQIGGSEYLQRIWGQVGGQPPSIDLEVEKNVQDATLELIRQRLAKSAHDISDGGLAVAIAECCVLDPLALRGASIRTSGSIREDFLLFGEDQSQIVVTIDPQDVNRAEDLLSTFKVPHEPIGKVTATDVQINQSIRLSSSTLANAYYNSLSLEEEPTILTT